jgi:hypothetical protein
MNITFCWDVYSIVWKTVIYVSYGNAAPIVRDLPDYTATDLRGQQFS